MQFGIDMSEAAAHRGASLHMTEPDVAARQRCTTFNAEHPCAKVATDNMPRDALPLHLFPTTQPQTRHPVLSNTAKTMGPFEMTAYSEGASAHCSIARRPTGRTLADVDGIRGSLGWVRWGRQNRRSWKGGSVAPKAVESRRRRSLSLGLVKRVYGIRCNVRRFEETMGMRCEWTA